MSDDDWGTPPAPLTEKPIRVPVPKRVRFDVFKRDKFTCQYCGRAAPEVVLECDHIDPVAGGGSSDITNLITSCQPCNGGKGAIPLSDQSAALKQHAMLSDLEERRQQIEMMMHWRDELRALDRNTLDLLIEAMARGGFEPSERQRGMVAKWLKRYSFAELLSAVDEAFDAYLVDRDMDSWKVAFSKVVRFADMARQAVEKPYIKKILYIQGILRNRTGCNGTADFLEALHLSGMSLEFLESEAKRTDYITHFTSIGMTILAEAGTPWTQGRPWS